MTVVEDLVKLRNTLMLIETKGENTKTMADCLRFLDRMIEDSTARTISEEKEQ